MKKLLLILLCLPMIGFSQLDSSHEECGTMLIISKEIEKNPNLESLIFEFEKDMKIWIDNHKVKPPTFVKSHFLADSILTVIQSNNSSNQIYTKKQLYEFYPEYFKRKKGDLFPKKDYEKERKKERNEK